MIEKLMIYLLSNFCLSLMEHYLKIRMETTQFWQCDSEMSSAAACILPVLSRRDISIWRPKPQRLPDRNTAVGPRARFSWVNVDAIWDTLTSGRRHPPPGGSAGATSFNPSSFTVKLGPLGISSVFSAWLLNGVACGNSTPKKGNINIEMVSNQFAYNSLIYRVSWVSFRRKTNKCSLFFIFDFFHLSS